MSSFPLLYKLDKKGIVRYFEIKVEGNTYFTRAGVLKNRNSHNFQVHERKARYTPSHGGYRTPEQIAQEHAQSLWTEKKRDDAMTEDLEELTNSDKKKYPVPIAPVLATRYKDLKERNDKYQSYIRDGRKPSSVMYCFPDRDFDVEPKYDGNRGTVSWCQETTIDESGNKTQGDFAVKIFSRGRLEIPHLDHIKHVFTKIYTIFEKSIPGIKSWHFDGEIMLPEESRNKMRSTISRIKEKHIDNDKIVFYVFDLITHPDDIRKDRRQVLETLFKNIKSEHVKLVPIFGQVKLTDDVSINEYMAQALNLGFEGIVMKDQSMKYPISNLRINEMVKMKPLESQEYRIYAAHSGIDRYQDCIIFDIEDLNDGTIRFSPGLKGWTLDDRKEAWQMYQEDPQTFIGKYLECVFVSKNEYGVPVECQGSRIRDPSDMSVADNDKSSRNSSRRSYGEQDD